jgi:hypothetical protein
VSLATPFTIRTLQRKLYAKAKPEERSACLGVKHIGKPYARFDEGGQATVAMIRLVRHRQTKGAGTDRPGLRMRDACSLLYRNSANP